MDVKPPTGGTEPGLDLNAIEFEPTGDPILDRGLQMTFDEVSAAAADSDHPDHEAAKAAASHMAEAVKGAVSSVYGDTFRRIADNVAAAARPDLDAVFRKAVTPMRAVPANMPPSFELPAFDYEIPLNETPEKTLDAVVELSERMSEMVRVAAEHRDVAVAQAQQSAHDTAKARSLTWWALAATWLASIVAVVSLFAVL